MPDIKKLGLESILNFQNPHSEEVRTIWKWFHVLLAPSQMPETQFGVSIRFDFFFPTHTFSDTVISASESTWRSTS